MTAPDSFERYLTSGDLIGELTSRATNVGANAGLWPGLTIYRFVEPTEPTWEEIRGLSLGIVAQGRRAVTDNGRRYVYDQFNYLVIGSHRHLQSEVLEASAHEPCLCLVLQIEPATVRRVSADMLERRAAPAQAELSEGSPAACFVCALDDELMSAAVRFLRSLSHPSDRRVLAPLYLQEMVYRVLRCEQFWRIMHFAARQDPRSPIAAALTYIRTHLADPLTVAMLAEQVNLSASAFTRTFRDITGSSPYQFVKETRLVRSRQLLVEQRRSVADVSAAVGYTSTSHFIKEFRSRFGTTPRDYADAQSIGRALRAVHFDTD